MTKKIKVEIHEVAEKTMYLHKHLGDGELGETKFNASLTLPTMSMLVTIDKKRYLVDSQELIQEIVKFHQNKEQ